MSRLAELARKVRSRGEATRGISEPHGAPLRVYLRWCKETGHSPRQENFCHYWRVVIVFAPARRLLPIVKAIKTYGPFAALLLVAVGIVAAVVLDTKSMWAAVAIAGVLASLVYFRASVWLLWNHACKLTWKNETNIRPARRYELLRKRKLSFVLLLIGAAPVAVVVAPFIYLIWLTGQPGAQRLGKRCRRAWKWFIRTEVWWKFTPVQLTVAALVVLGEALPPAVLAQHQIAGQHRRGVGSRDCYCHSGRTGRGRVGVLLGAQG